MVNQAKLRSYNTAPRYKYGFEAPKTYGQALCLDKRNGNTLRGNDTVLELTQIDDYVTFIDKGHHTKVKAAIGYRKIRVHLIYDIKHDGRHKARLVADGHLTEIPLESVYYGVVSLRGFRIVLFLAKLNHLKLWSTDIGNAYLEA
jgi:Reverse transcriptase (RNA-dependent DNA polymerase)